MIFFLDGDQGTVDIKRDHSLQFKYSRGVLLFVINISIMLLLGLGMVAVALGSPLVTWSNSTQCSNFSSLNITLPDNVHLINTTSVDSGALNITGVTGVNSSPFCRVLGTISYGAKGNDTLRFEVWLPDATYNGRYLSVGEFDSDESNIPYRTDKL